MYLLQGCSGVNDCREIEREAREGSLIVHACIRSLSTRCTYEDTSNTKIAHSILAFVSIHVIPLL
jgi:hypothetical protein